MVKSSCFVNSFCILKIDSVVVAWTGAGRHQKSKAKCVIFLLEFYLYHSFIPLYFWTRAWKTFISWSSKSFCYD